MSGTAVVMMVVICGVVWGGFALLLVRALRREGRKSGAAESGSGGATDGGG